MAKVERLLLLLSGSTGTLTSLSSSSALLTPAARPPETTPQLVRQVLFSSIFMIQLLLLMYAYRLGSIMRDI